MLTRTLFLAAFGSLAFAGQLANQSALITALGGPGTTETFSHFTGLASGTAVNLTCSALNSTSVCNSQGPGLVVPGINITFGSAAGQWNGVNYYGAPTQEVASNGQPLTVTFTTPVTAFGVNIRAYLGFAATATVTILGTDDATVIGTIPNIPLAAGATPTFVGWQATTGIGAVQFTQSSQVYSAPLEALEFGGTVGSAPSTPTTPIPPTWLLMTFALAILAIYFRRRVTVAIR